MSTTAYAGTAISKRLGRTPEGFLVCFDVPISRTAEHKPQFYRHSEVEPGGGDETVKVYRMASEVFSPTALASLEGKPLCGPAHPSEFVDGQNYHRFIKGHIQNIRRGHKLENGEQAVIADVVVYDAVLAEMIENGIVRECSVGYNAEYVRYRDGWRQRNITANHVAIVHAARGGSEVRIRDSMDSKKLIEKVNQIERMAEGLLSEQIVRESKETERLVRSGVGPSEFAERLRERSAAYRNYDDAQRAGEEFAAAAKAAGAELAKRFRPKKCTNDVAPLRQHGGDWASAVNALGRRMRGR